MRLVTFQRIFPPGKGPVEAAFCGKIKEKIKDFESLKKTTKKPENFSKKPIDKRPFEWYHMQAVR